MSRRKLFVRSEHPLTARILGLEWMRLSAARHVQVLEQFDGIKDQTILRFWADGRDVSLPPIDREQFYRGLDSFSKDHMEPRAGRALDAPWTPPFDLSACAQNMVSWAEFIDEGKSLCRPIDTSYALP